MRPTVSLLLLSLTLNCLIGASATPETSSKEKKIGWRDQAVLKKLPNDAKMDSNALVLRGSENQKKFKVNKLLSDTALARIDVEERDRPRKRKRRMDRGMMALLMAYKLKFMALIPTMLGGVFLLISTTLVAGFFFSLFAAVLGLKTH